MNRRGPVVRLAAVALIVSALVVGGVVYHRLTGARFVVQLAPASSPAVPSSCSGDCTRSWNTGAWFRATVTNVGHRGANMVCTADAFDRRGRIVYGGPLPTWSFPAGPFLEGGETHTWTARIFIAGDTNEPLARLVGSCQAIDYHGNPPI